MSTMPRSVRIAVDEIVDTSDVRRLAGVSQRHTLLAWRRADPTFPKPVAVTGSGVELFNRAEVVAWLRGRGREVIE